MPANGHTLGAVALIAGIDGHRIAFTGDLLTAGGHVYQLHTLEYSFGDHAGVLYTLQSLQALRAQAPELILPSHGPVIEEVMEEIELLEGRLRDVVPLGPLAGCPNQSSCNCQSTFCRVDHGPARASMWCSVGLARRS